MIKLSKCSTDDNELSGVKQAFSDAYLGMGRRTYEFEQALKTYLGTDYSVVCVNSGSAALHLSITCLDIGPGDEVLIPSITFAACFQVVSATGATPVACDIKKETLSLDLDSISVLCYVQMTWDRRHDHHPAFGA